MFIVAQGHVFAMEISSGEEFYIACDNTGTPLAVFSNNGLLLKQVCEQREEVLSIVFHLLQKNNLVCSYIAVCACVGPVHSIRRGLL